MIIFLLVSLFYSLNLSCIETIKIGSDYGGWTIPKDFINSKSICYCAGAGEDISFDIGLIKNFDCNVFCFDPTPRAINHVNNLKLAVSESSSQFSIPDKIAYDINKKNINKLNFFPFGLFNKNVKMKFYSPQNSEHVSHSIKNLQKTNTYFEADCYSLQTLMNKLGHKKINLLKLDIEGAEINVLNDIVNKKLDIDCICFEFDDFAGVNLQKNDNVKLSTIRADRMINKLKNAGYELIFKKGYISLTFLKKNIFNILKQKANNVKN